MNVSEFTETVQCINFNSEPWNWNDTPCFVYTMFCIHHESFVKFSLPDNTLSTSFVFLLTRKILKALTLWLLLF